MDIYAKFDSATKSFTAAALIRNGKPVGRIVLKFGSACTAFVHIWGTEMASGRASGHGYDKASAAVVDACRNLNGRSLDTKDPEAIAAWKALLDAFCDRRSGERWTSTVERGGFVVASVI